MTRSERYIVGFVVVMLLIGVFGVLVWRGQRPTANQPAPTLGQSTEPIRSDLLQSSLINRLKALEVNGSLPVTVVDDETHGEGRNPFE